MFFHLYNGVKVTFIQKNSTLYFEFWCFPSLAIYDQSSLVTLCSRSKPQLSASCIVPGETTKPILWHVHSKCIFVIFSTWNGSIRTQLLKLWSICTVILKNRIMLCYTDSIKILCVNTYFLIIHESWYRHVAAYNNSHLVWLLDSRRYFWLCSLTVWR
jgi:hypothetical protein